MKKRLWSLLLILVFLCGCGDGQSMDGVLALRTKLQDGGCSFRTKITADYGDQFYTFSMDCSTDREGNLQFCVTAPDSIVGISGSISNSGGKLEFDQMALAFSLLADGQLSPVSGPWVMMKALIGGYITSTGTDGEYTRVTIMDSYEDDALTVDIWLDQNLDPVHGEILWYGRRILTLEVDDFKIS